MRNLHIDDADIMTKASEYIDKIIKFVENLIDKGYAYSTQKGDVYYSVRKFKQYGKLSHRKIDELLNGVRKEVEEGKKDPLDFALWKSAKPGEISWKSPWGEGRPGWHIECSVMIYNTLGETIDIHGGGRDLIFPHHENEIAQSEALTGKSLAKYWSHCGLIKINGEKMSKSLGNSLTIRDALNMYNYEVIKYIMFSKHYTSDMNISKEEFQLSEKHLYYFYITLRDMEKYIKENQDNSISEFLQDDISENIIPEFIKVMDDDFNTVAALSNLYSIFKYANNIMKTSKKRNKKLAANTLKQIIKNIKEVYGILGLFTQEAEEFITEMKNKYIEKLNIDTNYIEEKIKQRIDAKQQKNYEIADSIREELEEKGIILNDTKDGIVWDVKDLY